MLERQLNVKVSSFSRPTDEYKDIKDRFKEIKMRKDKLKAQSYAWYLKIIPTNQARLMPAFDIKEGKIQMSFTKPIVQPLGTSTDYKKIDFEVLARDIHPVDQTEFHKQARKMIYSTLISKSIVSHQFQNSLTNISAQYKLEKASS